MDKASKIAAYFSYIMVNSDYCLFASKQLPFVIFKGILIFKNESFTKLAGSPKTE